MDTLEMLAEYYQDLQNASGGKVQPEEVEINMRVLVGRYYARVAKEDVGKTFFCHGYLAPHFWYKAPNPNDTERQSFILRCAEHPERRAQRDPADQYQRAKIATA